MPFRSVAQQKPSEPARDKKTISIQVTKEINGKIEKIDTTFVTTGDFDTDAFLKEKGISLEGTEGKSINKEIYILHPDPKEITWTESDGKSPDSVFIRDSRVVIINADSDKPHSLPGDFRQFHSKPMPPCCAPMHGPDFGPMMEGMVRSMGLEEMMPFGELEKIVVTKKRNGKKVIITFEDRDEACCPSDGNKNKEEKVVIIKNGEQGMAPQGEEKYIINGENGEKIIINKNVIVKGDEKTVTIKADVDNPAPVKEEKKVIIIKEEEIKK